MRNHARALIVGSLCFLISACSSSPTPSSPDWIRAPSRTVDGGYIVYVGTGEDPAPEKSTFKAESQALQDLANECSFAPKGTRIEDHYSERSGSTTLTYAKVGISFIDCDAAKAANDPEAIRKLASEPLAEQLKKYQDLVYAAAEPESETKGGEGNPMLNSTSGPPPIADEDHFFIVRQRVAFLKQTVILAPETVYVPAAPATVTVTRQLSSQTENLRVYEQANPTTKSWHRSWSGFEKTTNAEIPRSIPHVARAPGKIGHPERPGIHAPHAKLRPAPAESNPKAFKKKRRRRGFGP